MERRFSAKKVHQGAMQRFRKAGSTAMTLNLTFIQMLPRSRPIQRLILNQCLDHGSEESTTVKCKDFNKSRAEH